MKRKRMATQKQMQKQAKKLADIITNNQTNHKKRKYPINMTELTKNLGYKSKESTYKYLKLALKLNLLTREQYEHWQKNSKSRLRRKYKGEALEFNKARELVRSLKIKSAREFQKLKGIDFSRLEQIPVSPESYYKNKGWKGWGEFLGTKSYCKTPVTFEEAQEIVQKLGIKDSVQFHNMKKENHPMLTQIPSNPNYFYSKGGK